MAHHVSRGTMEEIPGLSGKPVGQPDDPVFEASGPVAVSRNHHSPISEDFGARLHEAQERLLELRQQQEKVERQREELEELRGKQTRFLKGRVDIVERLTKGLTRLDRETFQTRKRMEMLEHAKENFGKHLDLIESMHPEHWSRADLRNELVRATAAVEDAEQDYAEAMARLGMSRSVHANEHEPADPAAGTPLAGPQPDFRYWMMAGAAFFAPPAILVLAILLVRTILS